MVEEKEVPNSRWFPLVLKWLGSPFAWLLLLPGIVREIGTVVPPKFSCTLTFVVSEQDFHLAKLVGVLLPALELRATLSCWMIFSIRKCRPSLPWSCEISWNHPYATPMAAIAAVEKIGSIIVKTTWKILIVSTEKINIEWWLFYSW